MANPKDVVIQRDCGTGNMGTASDESDTVARFKLDGRFVVVFVRGTFSGSGTGTANMLLKIDSAAGSMYDHTLWTATSVGSTKDARLDVAEQREQHFLADNGDYAVCEWTNPDSPNITWALEVGLAKA